jgi:hypothetical protein
MPKHNYPTRETRNMTPIWIIEVHSLLNAQLTIIIHYNILHSIYSSFNNNSNTQPFPQAFKHFIFP